MSSVHFVSQDPLQESCLRFMSWRPPKWILYKVHIFGFMSQHLCVSGSSATSMSLDPCLSIHVYLRILCKIHAAGSIAQQPYVSQDLLQDPRLRAHVSASLYLRILCKIHVSDSCLSIRVSASMCISGSSARSMSLDPCLSIHVYLRILYKIHVFGFMSQQPYVSQDPLQDPRLRIHVSASLYLTESLQDPCLRIHVSASTNMDPLEDPCLRIHASASLYLRILCKIHVSDSCLSIRVSASMCISGSSARSMSLDPCLSIHVYLRILCKIHVFGFMSQHLCISRILCKIHVSDSCLSIFISQGPLQDPCLWIHVSASLYLRILCKIHVFG